MGYLSVSFILSRSIQIVNVISQCGLYAAISAGVCGSKGQARRISSHTPATDRQLLLRQFTTFFPSRQPGISWMHNATSAEKYTLCFPSIDISHFPRSASIYSAAALLVLPTCHLCWSMWYLLGGVDMCVCGESTQGRQWFSLMDAVGVEMCVCRESRQWFSLMDVVGVRQLTDATQLELICRKKD